MRSLGTGEPFINPLIKAQSQAASGTWPLNLRFHFEEFAPSATVSQEIRSAEGIVHNIQ